MDVTWESICDIELDGARVPKIVNAVLPDNVLAATDEITQGIERAHLKGRLSVLLSPLTNILPLVCTKSASRTCLSSQLLMCGLDWGSTNRLHQPAHSQAGFY